MDFEKERLMMSVEETKKRVIELLNENQLDVIIKYIFLEQKVKKQQEVIDKVIRYVEDYTNEERIITYEQYKSELLEILKEVSE